MQVTEDILYFIWKFRRFSTSNLSTTGGEELCIRSPGVRNTGSGPDFEQARIRINDIEWSGNVEIHVKASDWFLHKHSGDLSYDSIILHVVFIADREICREDGSLIPCLELQSLVDSTLLSRYRELMVNMSWIPCEQSLSAISESGIKTYLGRLTIETLQSRMVRIEDLLRQYKGSWNEAFYILLARNFGFKANAEPFELLARSVSRAIISRLRGNKQQVQSLLFGQAGMLAQQHEGEYYCRLRKEYLFLQKKYRIHPIASHLWKFGRLRPSNFPTLRIAQFGALLCEAQDLFPVILEAGGIHLFKEYLGKLKIDPFWDDHYHFRKQAEKTHNHFGQESTDNIICNTVAPFLFTYGILYKDQRLIDQSVKLLEELPPENNQVIRRFKKIGIISENMAESQAVLHLKKKYCDEKKCLDCGIGVKLLKRKE